MWTRQPRFVRVIGAAGFVMLVTTFHRWDWLYSDPQVWWRKWQGAIAFALCCLASGLALFHRRSPFTDEASPDSPTTVLKLNASSAASAETPPERRRIR